MSKTYVLDCTDLKRIKLAGCFEDELEANEFGRTKCKGKFVLIQNAEDLAKNLKVQHFKALRPNIGMQTVEKLAGTIKDEAALVWDVMEELNMPVTPKGEGPQPSAKAKDAKAKEPKAKKEKKAKADLVPRLGKYINEGLKTGKFKDMTPEQAVAAVQKLKDEGKISEKDKNKDIADCFRWYQNALRKDAVDTGISFPKKARPVKAAPAKDETPAKEEAPAADGQAPEANIYE